MVSPGPNFYFRKIGSCPCPRGRWAAYWAAWLGMGAGIGLTATHELSIFNGCPIVATGRQNRRRCLRLGVTKFLTKSGAHGRPRQIPPVLGLGAGRYRWCEHTPAADSQLVGWGSHTQSKQGLPFLDLTWPKIWHGAGRRALGVFDPPSWIARQSPDFWRSNPLQKHFFSRARRVGRDEMISPTKRRNAFDSDVVEAARLAF